MQPKIKLLRVLDILRETDETQPITAVGICKRLENEGITAERKSVCRDINTLIEYGYKIVLCHDNKKGYYMEEGGASSPAIPVTPVTLDLVHITVEYKKEDAEEIYALLGKGDEKEEGEYISAEIGVPSNTLFSNLFMLGTRVKLLEPTELKEEFEKKLDELSEFYKKRRSNGRMEVWLL